MNRNSLFFLIFAIIIAVGFTWLNSTWLTYKGFVFKQEDRQIDYYLSDFTILHTYPDGSMKYSLKGQHLVHQQSSGSSTVFSPVIQARDNNDSLVSITAKEAQQSKKDGPILLTDKVNIIKEGNKTDENFTLFTSNLTYNPLSKELSSDAELEFTSVSGKLTGVGFNTKLDEQELRIHKDVQAKFIPAQ